MLIRLKGGRIVDPVHGRDGVGDLYVRDGRIVDPPADGATPDETYDVTGKIVMAGGIDVHSHIAGGNVNTARLLLPEQQAALRTPRDGSSPGSTGWTAHEIGCRYAQMGFTTVIEPAMLPENALAAHLELADIPIIDTGALAVLGNDDFLLGLLKNGAGGTEIGDYMGWTLEATGALGVKVINAGGAAAFKYNARSFDLDDEVPAYGATSRQIVKALQHAVTDLGVPHPLHVHCNNLGMPGNADTAVATMAAAEGLDMHFAHIQFYGYGSEGKRGFSSAAPQISEAIAGHANVTVDVGQVLFGQTVTVSCDVLRQYNALDAAHPNTWVIHDGDASGGGIVPYRYSARSFANALQWAIGLEVVLMAEDLWRVIFSTDHPNGAPFTRYPEIFHLLMDADERARWLERLPAAARAMSHLGEIGRELSLSELAIITRAGPARLLGVADRGHLGAGALADIAVYADQPDRTAMFNAADLVFKSGVPVVKDGAVIARPSGRTLCVAPGYDRAIAPRLADHYERVHGVSHRRFEVPDDLCAGHNRFETVPCRS